MADLNVALLTGKSALITNQRKMNTVGHNIANADRAGFHRQRATTTNRTPLDRPNGHIGTGVQIDQVVRVYDKALEDNLRLATQADGESVHNKYRLSF